MCASTSITFLLFVLVLRSVFLILYYAVASQFEGVVRTHIAALRILDFLRVLPPKQMQTADSILRCRSASCAGG